MNKNIQLTPSQYEKLLSDCLSDDVNTYYNSRVFYYAIIVYKSISDFSKKVDIDKNEIALTSELYYNQLIKNNNMKEKTTSNETNPIIDEPFMKSKQVCNYLSISSSTLHMYVHSGKIKAYRIGERSLRFKRSDVNDFFKLIQ